MDGFVQLHVVEVQGIINDLFRDQDVIRRDGPHDLFKPVHLLGVRQNEVFLYQLFVHDIARFAPKADPAAQQQDFVAKNILADDRIRIQNFLDPHDKTTCKARKKKRQAYTPGNIPRM